MYQPRAPFSSTPLLRRVCLSLSGSPSLDPPLEFCFPYRIELPLEPSRTKRCASSHYPHINEPPKARDTRGITSPSNSRKAYAASRSPSSRNRRERRRFTGCVFILYVFETVLKEDPFFSLLARGPHFQDGRFVPSRPETNCSLNISLGVDRGRDTRLKQMGCRLKVDLFFFFFFLCFFFFFSHKTNKKVTPHKIFYTFIYYRPPSRNGAPK